MATIYGPPEEVGDPPDWAENRDDFDALFADEQAWAEKVQAWAKENGKGALAGEEFRHPIGDGYARYVVYTERPLALIHLPLGDAYALPEPHERGLRLADVRANVERARKLDELFGRKDST